jgi:hypothetical protein
LESAKVDKKKTQKEDLDGVLQNKKEILNEDEEEEKESQKTVFKHTKKDGSISEAYPLKLIEEEYEENEWIETFHKKRTTKGGNQSPSETGQKISRDEDEEKEKLVEPKKLASTDKNPYKEMMEITGDINEDQDLQTGLLKEVSKDVKHTHTHKIINEIREEDKESMKFPKKQTEKGRDDKKKSIKEDKKDNREENKESMKFLNKQTEKGRNDKKKSIEENKKDNREEDKVLTIFSTIICFVGA